MPRFLSAAKLPKGEVAPHDRAAAVSQQHCHRTLPNFRSRFACANSGAIIDDS
jgi:hypothetical protein